MNFTTLKIRSESSIPFYSDITYLPELQEFNSSNTFQNWHQYIGINSFLQDTTKESVNKVSFSWNFIKF